MALIPLTYKLDWYDPSQPGGVISTLNNNANTATSSSTQYSMQDIIDTVGGGISGAGLANEMTYWDGASSITYDAVTPFYYQPVAGGGMVAGRLGLGTSSPNFKMDISAFLFCDFKLNSCLNILALGKFSNIFKICFEKSQSLPFFSKFF